MPLALFGIENDGLNLAVNLVVLFLVVVWIALVVWTYMDARRRLSDPVLVASATVASLFPFVGTLVYSILRPPEFIDDKRERELEIRASELRVRQLEEQSCPNCGFPIERTYLRCPSCKARVKDPCTSCGKPIDPRWTLCPYCESGVRRAAPQTAAKRPARARAAAGAERRRKPAAEPARRTSSSATRGAKPAPRQAAKRPTRATKQGTTSKSTAAKRESAAPRSAPAEAESEERPRPAKT